MLAGHQAGQLDHAVRRCARFNTLKGQPMHAMSKLLCCALLCASGTASSADAPAAGQAVVSTESTAAPAVAPAPAAAAPAALAVPPAVLVPAPAAASPDSRPASDNTLEKARGGAAVISTDATLSGVVSSNSATQVTTGANIIQSNSFANASGIPVVIQNSGANVLIQNATVINLRLQ
jgi:hypothetical protein